MSDHKRFRKTLFAMVLASPFLIASECSDISCFDSGNRPPPLEIAEPVITPSWPAPENGVYQRGQTVRLNLAITDALSAPDFSEFCFHNEDVLNAPICFTLEHSNGNTQMLTKTGVVGLSPLGKHRLNLTKNTSDGAVTENVDGIEITIVDTLPAPPKKLLADPGLWSQSGPITMTLDTGEVKSTARTFAVDSQGMNVPSTIVIDPDTSAVTFVVTPKEDPMSNVGFGFVFVRVIGDGHKYVLEDMRIPQKPDPTRGRHTGNSTSFTLGRIIAADFTYTVEEFSGPDDELFLTRTAIRVKGTFNYGGTIFNIDQLIGENGEDTIIILFDLDRLLLTHSFGERGKVTLSFGRFNAENLNTDSGSLEIIDLDSD